MRSILHTIYFNFHYLPFKQAWKLPIILYKPKLLKLKGTVLIDSEDVRTGMIRLGLPSVSIYPNQGIVYENHGGVCVFKGKCNIGNASAISIGEKGVITFGQEFKASSTFKLACYHYISFGDKVHVGWESLFMDTDFHTLSRLDGTTTKGYGPIKIGANNWFGCKNTVLKNTITPDYCVIASNSLLNKDYSIGNYIVIGGNPCSKIAEGLLRDYSDDKINYEYYKKC